MAVTAAQIATLRRITAEPTTTTYSDALLTTLIEAQAVHDARGVSPWVLDYTTVPPSQTENTGWYPTYDLNAAAGGIWEEKAAAVACQFDANTDGADLKRSQKYAQYLSMARKFRSRAFPRAISFVKVERVAGIDGGTYETTPIIDALQSSVSFNAPDPT